MRAPRKRRGHLCGLPYVAIAALAGLSVLLTGCGQNVATIASSEELQGTGPITLALQTNHLTPTMRGQIDRWNNTYPDQHITVVELPNGPAAHDKLTADAAASTATADVMELPISEVKSFARRSVITALPAKHIPVEALPGPVQASIENDEDIYAAPTLLSVALLYYRADLLEAAGLSAPRTWEEVKNHCAAITPATQLDCFGLPMSNTSEMIGALTDAVSSSDGALIDDRGNPQADTAQVQEGIGALVARLSENTITAKSLTESAAIHRQNFLDGKLLFLQDTSTAGTELTNAQPAGGRVGVAALPSEHGGGAVTIEGSALAMSNNTENQQTAMAVIAQLAGTASSNERSVNDGVATAYPQYWNEEAIKHPALRTSQQVIPGAQQTPPVARFDAYRAAVCDELRPVLHQKTDVSEATKRLQQRLEELPR